tara:strand:+ start:37961 stop:38095 length:135 start_codon:yes stop_codon:yes gene_type:complete
METRLFLYFFYKFRKTDFHNYVKKHKKSRVNKTQPLNNYFKTYL